MLGFLVKMYPFLVRESSCTKLSIGVVLAPSLSKPIWELAHSTGL
jgi:hypothetical protein